MITENLSTLKIHKLTQAQYNREYDADRLDANALYLTPDEPLVTDATLSVSGAAADAKATGDAIGRLDEFIGGESVSDQITNALNGFSSGKTLAEHLLEEPMVLTSLQYGDTLPDAGTVGRIFFKKVSA